MPHTVQSSSSVLLLSLLCDGRGGAARLPKRHSPPSFFSPPPPFAPLPPSLIASHFLILDKSPPSLTSFDFKGKAEEEEEEEDAFSPSPVPVAPAPFSALETDTLKAQVSPNWQSTPPPSLHHPLPLIFHHTPPSPSSIPIRQFPLPPNMPFRGPPITWKPAFSSDGKATPGVARLFKGPQ